MDAVELGRATMGLFNWGKAVKDAGDGVSSAFTGVGSGISNIINSAKGQIPPEVQGQLLILEAQLNGDIKKAELDIQVKVKEIMVEAQQSVYDFALKYEGTAEQVPKWVLTMRSVIRPLITIISMGTFFLLMGMDIFKMISKDADMTILNSLPEQYWWILGIVVGFWFGSKGVENLFSNKKKVD